MRKLFVISWFAVPVLALAMAGDAAAQGVDFSKADDLGDSFVTWLRGNIAIVFFTVALIFAGFAAAFNRISWMWVLMIVVGALLAFGSDGLVSGLKNTFS